jgi:hypothetical protein
MKIVSFSNESIQDQFELDSIIEELLAPFCEEDEEDEE